jgi:hypothetical protein
LQDPVGNIIALKNNSQEGWMGCGRMDIREYQKRHDEMKREKKNNGTRLRRTTKTCACVRYSQH